MDSTSATLLDRVRDAADARAWGEFFDLYFPLLRHYARRRGLAETEAEEVAQDCMHTLAKKMKGLEYDPARGRFRGYLKTMVDRRIIDMRRRRVARQARTGELECVLTDEESEGLWDRLWLREHLLTCIDRLGERVGEQTVKAFKLYALEDRPVEEVCRRLEMSANQVYLAKTRMIRRLRTAIRAQIGDVLD